MATRAERAERSRTNLISAATAALIAGNGDFELQEIARRARVSVGLAYHRFGSKAGLIAAVVDHFYDEIEKAMDLGDFHYKDWAVRERERLSRLIDFLYSHKLTEVIISKLARDPEVAAVETKRWKDLTAISARNIIKSQERGQVPRILNASILSAMISGAVRHALSEALTASPRPSKAELSQSLWTFITRGMQLDAKSAQIIPLKPLFLKRSRK
ncbi:MAG: TetR/AcrR family transcriptional regulator [Rhodospirillaceae bacterium]|nr:TetR/AcrR family transcriptional regulator [Rhodospirillaceae bacterium]